MTLKRTSDTYEEVGVCFFCTYFSVSYIISLSILHVFTHLLAVAVFVCCQRGTPYNVKS